MNRLDKHTTEEKRIRLESGECRRANRIFKLSDRIKFAITEILSQGLEDAIEAEDNLWDEMSVRAGFSDLEDAHRQGFSFKIDWLTDEIVVMKKTQTGDVSVNSKS